MVNQDIFSEPEALELKREEHKNNVINNQMMSAPEFNNLYMDLFAYGHDIAAATSSPGRPGPQMYTSPYIVFFCNQKGKAMIEGCFEIMNELLIKRGIPIIPNELKITHRHYLRPKDDGYPESVLTKALVWSYDIASLESQQFPTHALKAYVLTALHDAFRKGYAIP